MKVGFVSNSHGNLDLLEAALLALLEKESVDAIVAVDQAAYDADAVLRVRKQRHPQPVEWDAPGYADYVLGCVLHGVSRPAPDEIERTEALAKKMNTAEKPLDIEGHAIALHLPARELPKAAAVVHAGHDAGRVDRADGPPLLCPGHLRAREWEGEPATCAVVEVVEGKLRARFVDLAGETVGEAVGLEGA